VDAYVGEWNQSYVTALGSLRSAMDQVASAPPATRPLALSQAGQAANQAEGAVRTLAQGFGIDPEGQTVRTALTDLLLQPVRRAEALIGALPVNELNQQGQRFCRDFGRLLDGFPFGPSGQASVDDVTAALKPGESALWTFHQDVLEGLVARQGSRFEARLGAEPPPRRDFVEFFNRAAAVSEALFDSSGRGPQIAFTLRPQIPSGFTAITVNVDGQPKRFTPTDLASPTFVWEGQRAQYARITGEVDGVEQPLLDFTDSPWSIFRLFQQARWEAMGRSRYMVHWTLPGRGTTLSAELGLTTPNPILDPAFLTGAANCVARIAG
jgi:type VI secretion system protein ImpL